MTGRHQSVCGIVAAIVGLSVPAWAEPIGGAEGLTAVLARIGARVEAYFARAQSIVCDERVYIRSLGYSSAGDGPVRSLDYELRVAWEAASDRVPPADASVLRQLRAINGRAPRSDDDPGCMDPKSVSPEPLSMLLPGRQAQYVFSADGTSRVNGREVTVLAYRPRVPGDDAVTWSERCVSVDSPGRMRGRIWADAGTGDVLRMDEQVSGIVEFAVPEEHRAGTSGRWMALEHATSSIRYRPVAFVDPDEMLMLPSSVQSHSVWRGTGSRRVITTQDLSACRRFITDARIVDPGPR